MIYEKIKYFELKKRPNKQLKCTRGSKIVFNGKNAHSNFEGKIKVFKVYLAWYIDTLTLTLTLG